MSVQVLVRSINSRWEQTYTFDSQCNLTFGNLKNVIQLSNPKFHKRNQILVHMGCIVNSDETLVYDCHYDTSVSSIELDLFVVNCELTFPKQHTWKIDDLSILAAKKFNADRKAQSETIISLLGDVMLLVDIVADEYLQPAATAESPAPALMAEETSPNPAVPAAAPVAAPVPVVVPALQLPVVEWLQWGVMARLLLVAFLFTYNRNLSTEKLAHMAVMTLFSYLFQIGAFGYFIAWICHVLGFNFNPPPPEPMPVVPNPAAEGAGGPDAAVQDGMAGAGVPPDGNAGGVAGARGAGGVGGAAGVPAPAPRAPPAPLNMVQYLNVLYHSGFTIPTAPGILLDVVSLFMGLFFSIVPSWAPYRLHR